MPLLGGDKMTVSGVVSGQGVACNHYNGEIVSVQGKASFEISSRS
jgi:uncharacterized protein YodC (DUF2158 family)